MATATKGKTELTPKEEALKDIADGLLKPEDVGHLIDTGFITLDEALAVVTKGVKRNADKAKEWEDRKSFDRAVFFELATRYAEDEEGLLEKQSIQIKAASEDEMRAEVKKRYPLFRVIEFGPALAGPPKEQVEIAGAFDVLIEEDPAKIKVSVQYNGFEFTRGVTMRGAGFDVKRFMMDHAIMENGIVTSYEDIVYEIIEQSVSLSETMNLKGVQTKAVLGSSLAELIEEGLATVTYSLNDKKAEAYLEENPATLEMFQSYVIAGTPSSSLLAPKKLSKKAKK